MSAIRTGFTPRLRIRPRTPSDRMGGARRATRTGRAPATSRRRRSYTDIDLPWAHPCSVAPACSGGKRAPRCARVTFGPATAFARRYVGLACACQAACSLRCACAMHAPRRQQPACAPGTHAAGWRVRAVREYSRDLVGGCTAASRVRVTTRLRGYPTTRSSCARARLRSEG